MPNKHEIGVWTHDNYWNAKKDIERLRDANERGMLQGMDDVKRHLKSLIEKVYEFEKEHPLLPY